MSMPLPHLRPRLPTALAAALACLGSAGACDQQTAASPYCEETVTVLASLDSPTPAGPTAGELFALIEGPRTTELEYLDTSSDGVRVEIEPGGSGTTTLDLDLSRAAAGELRWIDAEEVYPTGPGPTIDIAIDCPDRLEIDATLGFATADGAFAEVFEVVVTIAATTVSNAGGGEPGELRTAEIRQPFSPEQLAGALEVVAIDPPDPNAVDYAIEIAYPLTESNLGPIGEPSGTIGGGAEYEMGDTVSYGFFELARFGAADPG